MATYTSNYSLEKPLVTERYDVGVFNGNADIIDGVMHDNAVHVQNTQDMIAPPFDTNTAYAIGDRVTYNNNLYQFTSAHAVGAWDSSEVTIVNISDDIPENTSDLTNDSGFITNTVNNLVNYYLKTETYSKTEVDALLQAITTLDIQAVNTLPTTNISTTTIYLVPKQDPQVPDVKDEYINLDGTTSGWELIGNTQIDLSNYVTTSDLTTALQSYATKAYVDGLIGNLSSATTTDKSSAVGAINEVNKYFVNLEPISEANINAFFKNVCAGFLALNPIPRKPHSIFAEWSQHNNYFGQIVDINDDVVVATLTSAGGSQVISGYYRVTGDELVVYPYSPSTRSYGAVVDISSYDTTTNLYTVPNDGMVVLAVNDVAVGAEVSLMDIDANLNMGMSIGNGAIQLVNSVMVIKGQRIYSRKINASNAAVYYRPLN